MSARKISVCVGLVTGLFAATPPGQATTVKQFQLDGMTASAARIFRGTVIDIRPGTVRVGGAELPTTTYRFRVIESFKGALPATRGDTTYADVTMIGSVKTEADRGGVRHFSVFRDVPRLARGRDYLLFLTAESRVALSTTVGLAQGCFDIDTSTPAQPTANRSGNAGLLPGLKGSLPYDRLAARIRAIVASQKGGKR